MNRLKILAAAALLALTAQAGAVEMTAAFSPLVGNTWQVSLNLKNNDGLPASIEEFTLYFPETLYADLLLVASPASWDSLVVQPEPAPVSSSGYLDSLVMAPASALTIGQSQGGFTVQFAYLGSGSPSGLSYDIIDPLTFAPIASGVPVAVPEPGTLEQVLAGAGMLMWLLSRRRNGARGVRS